MASKQSIDPQTSIAIIGGGWYGCYIAKYLHEIGGYRQITLFEKNDQLIRGTSGQAFNRLHVGPHYPRCAETRQQVQANLLQFEKEFPQLIVNPVNSFYTLGTSDANGNPSLVTSEQFEKVCMERPDCEKVSVSSAASKYHIKLNCGDSTQNSLFQENTLYKMNEPVLYMARPRAYFSKLFQKYGIKVFLNCQVTTVSQTATKRVHVESTCTGAGERVHAASRMFDFVVNCTYYTGFLSKQVTVSSTLDRSLGSKNVVPKVVYEPCISLLYEPPSEWKNTDKNLWSFTVMDGGFPCLMPFCIDSEEEVGKKDVNKNGQVETRYVLYHAHFSNLGKIDNYQEAVEYVTEYCQNKKNYSQNSGEDGCRRLKLIDEIENDFSRFMKDFKKDFKYIGYNVLIRTKLDVEKEFRANFVWQDCDNDRLIQVFSGKITNCVNAAPIVLSVIKKENLEVRCNHENILVGTHQN